MDSTPIVLPANWLALYQIVANPVTFGVLISMILATFKFMKPASQDKNGVPIPGWKKMGVVILTCLVWSIVINVLSPDGFALSKDSIYNILMMTFAVAFTTQIWHQVVSPFVAQVIAILFGVAIGLKARAERITAHG